MNELGAPIQSPQTSQLTRIRYRIRQFVHGFFADRLDPEVMKRASQRLPGAARQLFAEMPPDVQRHSISVLTTLRAAGYNDPDLAAAALLHDVGKSEAQQAGVRINLWMRGLLVVAEATGPVTLKAQASSTIGSAWRYALYVHFEHPRIGAEWARAAGCSEKTCWLIAHHQDTVYDGTVDMDRQRLLAALQWADGMN